MRLVVPGKSREKEKKTVTKVILIIMCELCKTIQAPVGAPTGLFHLF